MVLLKINSMQQNPEKLIVSQLVMKFLTLMQPEDMLCVYKSLPLDPVLSHMNPVYILIPYFCKIQLNVALPTMPRSSKWSLLFILSSVCISHPSHKCYMTCSSQSF